MSFCFISPNLLWYSTQLRLKLRDPSNRCIKTIQLFIMGGSGPSAKLIPNAIETGTKYTAIEFVAISLPHCRLFIFSKETEKRTSWLLTGILFTKWTFHT